MLCLSQLVFSRFSHNRSPKPGYKSAVDWLVHPTGIRIRLQHCKGYQGPSDQSTRTRLSTSMAFIFQVNGISRTLDFSRWLSADKETLETRLCDKRLSKLTRLKKTFRVGQWLVYKRLCYVH